MRDTETRLDRIRGGGVAKRHNATIRAYAERLRAAGKPFKVVITACMRKILIILNVMVKTNAAWNEQLVVGTCT